MILESPLSVGSRIESEIGSAYTLGEKISTEGAHGDVYRVVGHQELLAKIYKHDAPARLSELISAFERLIAGDIATGRAPAAAYPHTVLRARDRVVGYLMGRMPFGAARIGSDSILEIVTLESAINRADEKSLDDCLHLAKALTADVAYFHRHGFIVADMSGRNTLVTDGGLPIWIDLDSFGFAGDDVQDEIAVSGLSTPSFGAPELRLKSAKNSRSSDDFTLAKIVLTLLMQGIDPFAYDRKDVPTTDRPGSTQDRINLGWYWPAAPAEFDLHSDAARACGGLPGSVVSAARKTFGTSRRTTARQWSRLLSDVSVEPCGRGHEKFGGEVCSACPAVQVSTSVRHVATVGSSGRSGVSVDAGNASVGLTKVDRWAMASGRIALMHAAWLVACASAAMVSWFIGKAIARATGDSFYPFLSTLAVPLLACGYMLVYGQAFSWRREEYIEMLNLPNSATGLAIVQAPFPVTTNRRWIVVAFPLPVLAPFVVGAFVGGWVDSWLGWAWGHLMFWISASATTFLQLVLFLDLMVDRENEQFPNRSRAG